MNSKPSRCSIGLPNEPNLFAECYERVERHGHMSDPGSKLQRDLLVVDDEFAEYHGERLAIRGCEHVLLLHDSSPDEGGKLRQPVLGLGGDAHEAHLYIGFPVLGVFPPLTGWDGAKCCMSVLGASSRDFIHGLTSLYCPMLESSEGRAV